MKSENKIEEQIPALPPKATKTEVISFKVTPEQKTLLIDKAVKENGLTLPEFALYKLFREEPENIKPEPGEPIKDILPDEEREALEALIRNQRSAIADLTQQLYEIKSEKIDLNADTNPELTLENQDTINFFLSDEGKKWITSKGGFFGGEYETDLANFTESDMLNILINVIQYLKDDEPGYFKKAFHLKAADFLSSNVNE